MTIISFLNAGRILSLVAAFIVLIFGDTLFASLLSESEGAGLILLLIAFATMFHVLLRALHRRGRGITIWADRVWLYSHFFTLCLCGSIFSLLISFVLQLTLFVELAGVCAIAAAGVFLWACRDYFASRLHRFWGVSFGMVAGFHIGLLSIAPPYFSASGQVAMWMVPVGFLSLAILLWSRWGEEILELYAARSFYGKSFVLLAVGCFLLLPLAHVLVFAPAIIMGITIIFLTVTVWKVAHAACSKFVRNEG